MSFSRTGFLPLALTAVLAALTGAAGVLVVRSPPHAAASTASWTVRPEWVRAHEQFLASDVLAGRGSATRDEHIAASYVAARFLSYGLQPAPGMDGYIQSAELQAPRLDGAATLTIGGVMLREGADFQLLTSSGETVQGHLARLDPAQADKADISASQVVLLQGDAGATRRAWRQVSGAGAVLLVRSEFTDNLIAQLGGTTRVSVRLKEDASSHRPTLVALSAAAAKRIARLPDDAVASLVVHPVPQAEPRRTYNAIGYLPGTDRSAGTILLTSHLDHLGAGAPVDGDAIYNGANDDAAGTTAVLELAHALAAGPRLRRSVLFVCYGSEEIGGLGSTYFGKHPPIPLDQLVANLEFEMVGAQDPKMPKGTLLLTGWERSNLGPALKKHGALLGPDPYPEQHFFQRSDNYSLALLGVVAHTAAGWGTVPTYHRPDDDIAHLDLPFMTTAIQSLVGPVRWLANSDFKPAWNPGGRPSPKH